MSVKDKNIKKEAKIICQNPDCIKMKRYQSASNFYKSRNLSIGHHPYCKDCVNDLIDKNNMQTIYDVLKVLDTPFIKEEWDKVDLDSKTYFSDYLKIINFTKMKKYKDTRWIDSIYDSEEGLIEESDSDDMINEWNEDWQGTFTLQELKYLDKYYNDLLKDFKVVTGNHKDYARKIAKASLAANNAYNKMMECPTKENIDVYNTTNSNFDRLSKSAQFTESQRGANDVSLGCFGRVFDAVEKHNWVPKHVPNDEDLYDKMINQFANIKKSL